MPSATGVPLRTLVLALAVIEWMAVLLFVGLMMQPSDPLGRAIGMGMARLAAVPLLVFIVPALILGLLDRWLPAALTLLVLAVPASVILWRLA